MNPWSAMASRLSKGGTLCAVFNSPLMRIRLTSLFLSLSMLTTSALRADDKTLSYNRDVRPILASKCFACHGPDEDKREADLRLDIRGEHFDEKAITERIETTDPDDIMPPPSSPKPLTREEISIHKRRMAGGGVKGGQVYGETDDFAWHVARDPVSIHDFHATILNLFGLNHNKLTYRFQGLDFRLTGVNPAKVVKGLIT